MGGNLSSDSYNNCDSWEREEIGGFFWLSIYDFPETIYINGDINTDSVYNNGKFK